MSLHRILHSKNSPSGPPHGNKGRRFDDMGFGVGSLQLTGLLLRNLELSYHRKCHYLVYTHIMVTSFKSLSSNPDDTLVDRPPVLVFAAWRFLAKPPLRQVPRLETCDVTQAHKTQGRILEFPGIPFNIPCNTPLYSPLYTP